MRRIALICTVVAAGSAAIALPSPAPARDASRTARLVACHTGADSAQRFLVVAARMRARGAKRMGIRLDLQRAIGNGRYEAFDGPGIGVWRASRAGVSGFGWRKRVENLGVGTWRVVARFRWLSAGGRTIRKSRVVARTCRQPDPRPDLKVKRIGVTAGRLVVSVSNAGGAPTGGFAIDYAIAGAPAERVTVGDLAAHETRRVELPSGCRSGQSLLVIVDPEDVVDERREDNNRRETTCAGPGS